MKRPAMFLAFVIGLLFLIAPVSAGLPTWTYSNPSQWDFIGTASTALIDTGTQTCIAGWCTPVMYQPADSLTAILVAPTFSKYQEFFIQLSAPIIGMTFQAGIVPDGINWRMYLSGINSAGAQSLTFDTGTIVRAGDSVYVAIQFLGNNIDCWTANPLAGSFSCWRLQVQDRSYSNWPGPWWYWECPVDVINPPCSGGSGAQIQQAWVVATGSHYGSPSTCSQYSTSNAVQFGSLYFGVGYYAGWSSSVQHPIGCAEGSSVVGASVQFLWHWASGGGGGSGGCGPGHYCQIKWVRG